MMIEEKVLLALPDVPQELVQKIVSQLQELGVTSDDDLQLVVEDDLKNLGLKPIQIRRLLRAWNVSNHKSSTFNITQTVPTCTNTNIKNSNNSKFDNFSIPWDKFPSEVKQACENKKRPLKKYILQMVRILSAEIIQIHKHPGRKIIRSIVQEVVQKYPETFEDKIDDTVVAGGFMSLLKRVETHIDNCNRPKSVISVFDDSNDDEEPLSRKRKSVKDGYGCVQWQPESLADNETKESQINKQEWLKNEYRKINRDEETIKKYMDLTYATQRLYINYRKPPAKQIKLEWPFLTEAKCLWNHCETLLGFNADLKIKESLSVKGKKIFDFMKTTKRDLPKIQLQLKDIATAKLKLENQQPETTGSILLIMAYFNEEISGFLQCNQVSVSDKEIESEACSEYPHIVTSGGDIFSAESYSLVFEKTVFCTVKNFSSAFSILFACYYVFNVEYNQSVSCTLDFIQRCFADLNPSRGTKTSRQNMKGHHCNPKVLHLVNELTDFESVWTR